MGKHAVVCIGDTKGITTGAEQSDLLMRKSVTGTVEVVQMDGVNATAVRDYGFGTGWPVAEANADYNGDAKFDLLMRNPTTQWWKWCRWPEPGVEGHAISTQYRYATLRVGHFAT